MSSSCAGRSGPRHSAEPASDPQLRPAAIAPRTLTDVPGCGVLGRRRPPPSARARSSRPGASPGDPAARPALDLPSHPATSRSAVTTATRSCGPGRVPLGTIVLATLRAKRRQSGRPRRCGPTRRSTSPWALNTRRASSVGHRDGLKHGRAQQHPRDQREHPGPLPDRERAFAAAASQALAPSASAAPLERHLREIGHQRPRRRRPARRRQAARSQPAITSDRTPSATRRARRWRCAPMHPEQQRPRREREVVRGQRRAPARCCGGALRCAAQARRPQPLERRRPADARLPSERDHPRWR